MSFVNLVSYYNSKLNNVQKWFKKFKIQSKIFHFSLEGIQCFTEKMSKEIINE